MDIALDRVKTMFFVGIGGISMSGLAEIFTKRGKVVRGSDRNASPATEHLETLGISVAIGHRVEHITEDIDLLVYTAAIPENNPELVRTKALGIPTMERAELVGLLMDEYKHKISVAGTHGKTSTTSMFAHVLMEAKKDPTISLGGYLDLLEANYRYGQSDYFLLEACEYKNSFHHFRPSVSVILNIASDHLDFFKDYDDVRQSFQEYMAFVPKEGTIVINAGIERWWELVEGSPASVVTFGESSLLCDEKGGEQSDQGFLVSSPLGRMHLYYKNLVYKKDGCPMFTVVRDMSYGDLELAASKEKKARKDGQSLPGSVVKTEELGTISLSVQGRHNVLNALAVIAGSLAMGIDFSAVKQGLEHFSNSKRRLEYKGEVDGVRVYDDYAHHPDEIHATLDALQRIEKNRMWFIFQPHTYTRTKALFDDFVEVLSEAGNVILAPIYAAREQPIDVSSLDLHRALERKVAERKATEGTREQEKIAQQSNFEGGQYDNTSYYLDSFDEIVDFLKEHAKEGDLVITVGAGDIYQVGERYLGMK